MLSEQEIISRLKEIGFQDTEVPSVMKDVAEIVCGRALAEYLPALSQEERAKLASLETQELQGYLEEHADALPRFSQEAFDRIHDDTWREYFMTVS